ncbi:TetR/AcrR family transcriptional regulator [uncultured Sanguibacteroides sp.]|uniref:TetR/AcrR family transcriptional regulator n=1 Tax=uncultured Sanguibacteroides sp. TaxID=1635151 RepID=UPI0025DBF765|nr:TetR/AcrR family transcriptional regulator [uncultured Sanguibacteroides sp.]
MEFGKWDVLWLLDSTLTPSPSVTQKLFLRKGYLKTSTREITKRADVGLGDIYNYFSNTLPAR